MVANSKGKVHQSECGECGLLMDDGDYPPMMTLRARNPYLGESQAYIPHVYVFMGICECL